MPASENLYDNAAVRRIEAAAADALGDDYGLMQQAGQAAWRCLLECWPSAQRIDVLCGTGNNGGDGYLLATLARQSGREVRVLTPIGATPRSAPAQRARHEYLASGGSVKEIADVDGHADLLVDALLGIGMSRPPDAALAGVIHSMNLSGCPVFALDVPSGVDADSGAVAGVAVRAALTLQFIVAHRGLYTGDALEFTGQRRVAVLELAAGSGLGIRAAASLWSAPALAEALPRRRLNTHKGESGHVLCLGGNHGSGGAVILCAQAALRAGAGLVSVATRGAHASPLLMRCPEAMPHALDHQGQLPALFDRASVVALGPGLGKDDWARALFAASLDCDKPLVIDADGLNLLAERPQPVANAVLTPHPGEAARLLGISTAQVQADRFGAAQRLSECYAATVVLKGAGTIVAAPGQLPRVIAAGNPGMAVGGMGDLLTGVVAALVAQGLTTFEAASNGALLHALAGDAASAEGERGLLPSDLLPHLRRLANP